MNAREEEPDIWERIRDGACSYAELGEPSQLTCSECGGSLSKKADGGLITYRRRVGHAYSAAHLDSAQSDAVEAALWAAVPALRKGKT